MNVPWCVEADSVQLHPSRRLRRVAKRSPEQSRTRFERQNDWTADCLVGAHGLMQVGANSQGSWTSNGYSKSTSGGAVAFVYVDPTGRPLPPRYAPRILIQPGALPNPAP